MGLLRYEVIATDDAEADLDEFVFYLLCEKCNRQAAENLIEDYLETIEDLSLSAGSLKLDDDEKCAALGYHRIHFKKHRYFMLFRLEGDTAIIDRIFHDLQDYKNHI